MSVRLGLRWDDTWLSVCGRELYLLGGLQHDPVVMRSSLDA